MLTVVTLAGGQLESVRILSAEEGEEGHSAKECKSGDNFNNPARCGDKEPNPILPEMREIVWGFGSFIVLAIVMRFFLYPRVKGLMDARAAKIDGDLAAADNARSSVQAEQQAYADRIATARAEAAGIIEAARAEIEAERSAKLGALNAELSAQRQAATAEIDAAVANARASFADTVAELAVGAASKVVAKPIDKAANLGVINDYVAAAGGSR